MSSQQTISVLVLRDLLGNLLAAQARRDAAAPGTAQYWAADVMVRAWERQAKQVLRDLRWEESQP